MITNFGLSPSKVVRPLGSFQNLIGQLQEQDGRRSPKVCVIYMYASSYKVIVIKDSSSKFVDSLSDS